MKKSLVLCLALALLVGCGYNDRLTYLENQINQNNDRIQTLYNREVYNPIIADSHISLMRMSTVIVVATHEGRSYRTSGFAVQTTEHVDGVERDIVYVWTVAHAVTRGTLVVKQDEESGEPDTEYELFEYEDVSVTFNIGPPLESTFDAEVVQYDLSLDLALLKVDITDGAVRIPDIRFAEERRKVGEPVFAVGHPGPRTWALTEGLVSSYELMAPYLNAEGEYQIGEKIMETTMDVSYGYSGSPVFDPMTGRIYGYISRMTPDTRDALVYPIELLVQFAVDYDYEYALPD